MNSNGKKPNIVYRALRDKDVISLQNGKEIIAPALVPSMSPAEHIRGNYDRDFSPWISTTKNPIVAYQKYARGSTNRVVMVDLNKVTSKVVYAYDRKLGDPEANLLAYEDEEILVYGYIPQAAIINPWNVMF